MEVVEADPAAVHFLCRKVLPAMMILLERWCGFLKRDLNTIVYLTAVE